MKKRLLSLALCLALCLGLFPFGALAANETVSSEDSNTDYVASVMDVGETVNYTSLDDALDAAKDGDTVKLLGDAEITKWRSLTAAITLDLNGKTITTQSKAELYIHAQVIVQDSSTGKTGGMAGTYLLNVQSNGDLIIRSGTFNGRIAINDGKLTINGGTFNQEVALPRGDSDSVFFSGGTFAKIWYPNSSGSFLDLLADGYAFFYTKDSNLVNAAEISGTFLYNVQVQQHTHSFTDGACACGYTCPHTSVNESSVCTVCGKQMAASVTVSDAVTYYDTFSNALVYASKNDGCTLKLLANVESAVSIEVPLIFDLNGHNVQGLSVCAKVTVRDSSTEKGKIGKVLIFDKEGETPNLTLGDLLEEGYAFQYENGSWANDSHLRTSDGLKVTVEKAPIQSVAVFAKDKNNNEVSTNMAYGTTGEVTLVSSCQMGETSGADLTYLWYKLEGAAATAPMEGVNGVKYKLPADLPAGKHTYLVTCTSGGYSKSAEITITVTPISLECAEVTVQNPTYNGKEQGPEVTVKLGDKTLWKDNDYTMEVPKQIDAGSYKLTIKGGGNYSGTIEKDWKIEPIKIDHAKFVKNITKTYSGEAEFTLTPAEKTNCLEFYDSHMTPISIPEGEYTISGMRFVAKNAEGEYVDSPQVGDKVIQFTITFLSNNYVLQTACDEQPASSKTYNQSGGATFTITKADAPTVTPGKLTVVNNHEGTYTYDLKQLLPTAPNGTYGNIDWNGGYQHSFSSQFSYVKNYTIDNDGILTIISHDNNLTTTGKVGTITITVITDNYENISLPIEVFAENKILPELDGSVSLSKTAITFGESLDSIIVSGTMKDGDTTVEGTFSWAASKELYPAGTHEVEWIFTPTNSGKYAVATGKVTITVNKATPTGKPEYTAITTSGKKLSDASLTQTETSFSVPGTVAWNLPADTEVTANTAYTWKFTPQDEQNYNDLTGTITLWHKSSSGSSSGSVTPGSKTDTVKNPDGSTTKTETKADGSKTETTTASSGGGSTGTTVTKTDAKGNTTTEASAKLSDRDVKEAQEKGEAVTVPVKGIAAAKDANAATKIKIDVPNNANKTTVEIPVENVTSGTVAVIVHEDGTEELVKDSKPTEHGVQLELSGSTTVKIIDNSKTFDDTKDHWSRDEVNFVAARELFNGVGGNQFGVSQPMTRGMVNTVLARLADVDTTPGQGQAWYEVGTDWAKKNGISDGTNPTAPVTREQLATLLYRYAGSPSVSGTLHAADAASVSDYAKDALLWANQNGIVNGVGSNTIAPKDNAQRAQVAAMLARYLQNQ